MPPPTGTRDVEMAFGDIHYFETTNARGYATRKKYHLHIVDATFRHDELCFFISEEDYLRDMPLRRRPEHEFMPYELSHVSIGDVIEVGHLRSDNKVGALHPSLYAKLYAFVDKSPTLVTQWKSEILDAITMARNLMASAGSASAARKGRQANPPAAVAPARSPWKAAGPTTPPAPTRPATQAPRSPARSGKRRRSR